MGIVWEAYHKGVPLLGVPGITLDFRFFTFHFGGGMKYVTWPKLRKETKQPGD